MTILYDTANFKARWKAYMKGRKQTLAAGAKLGFTVLGNRRSEARDPFSRRERQPTSPKLRMLRFAQITAKRLSRFCFLAKML